MGQRIEKLKHNIAARLSPEMAEKARCLEYIQLSIAQDRWWVDKEFPDSSATFDYVLCLIHWYRGKELPGFAKYVPIDINRLRELFRNRKKQQEEMNGHQAKES